MNSGYRITVFWKTVAFFAAWVLLSDSYEVFHLALGCVLSLGVALLNTPDTRSPLQDIRWVGLLTYVPWLLARILQSGIHLSMLILHPRLPIDPKLLRYETKLRNPAAIVLLGNSITLTPGTITADLNSTELLVHAMDDQAAGDVTSLRMERNISAAFGLNKGSQ